MNITTEMVMNMKATDVKDLHDVLLRLEGFLIDQEGPGWRDVCKEVQRVRQGIVKPQVVFDEPDDKELIT